MAGYSGTPLARKLGIRPGARVALLSAPAGFEGALDPLPEAVRLLRRARKPADVVVCFCADRRGLERQLPRAVSLVDPDGGLWVAWPKKSSGVATELSFDVVQPAGLDTGMVDNKVCAVDEVWSALRFVHRLENRAALRARH